jgi:hypothetical protein
MDTYKYSDYPESGISPDQYAPPAAAGQQAAAPAAAQPAAPATGLPAAVAAAPVTAAPAAAAGGVPHLAPAPAGLVPPAAPPGLIPFAAAALPADPAEFALPTEWQDIYPLPPDSADSSVSNEFYDATSANSTQDGATALGEDDIRLEGEGTEDYSTDRLEADSDDHHAQPRTSPPFRGFAPPPAAARGRVTFSPQLHYFEEEEEPDPGDQEAQPPSEPRGVGTTRRGARGDLAEAFEIDPESSSVDQQALFYNALLEEVDRHTEEAERALQALQGASRLQQLRQRTLIVRWSRVLRDELDWAERHLRPEALEAVGHCRLQSDQQPPARGQVHPHAAQPTPAAGPPAQQPSGPRQPIPGHPLFPPPTSGAARPQSPLGRGSPSHPSLPTDRTLRSRTRPPPDDRHPDPSPRGGRR